MRLDEAPDDGEPETGAPSRLVEATRARTLAAVEPIPNAILFVWGNAGP